MERAYRRAVEMMLRENQVTLFAADGSPRSLDLQRHVHNYAATIGDCSADETMRAIIQLSIDLWSSWEVHLVKSEYGHPHYSGVHFEDRWISRRKGAPPCVILSNEDIRAPGEQKTAFPFEFTWASEQVLGEVSCWSFELEDVGVCYRLYLDAHLT
jgi:hypothetical protein